MAMHMVYQVQDLLSKAKHVQVCVWNVICYIYIIDIFKQYLQYCLCVCTEVWRLFGYKMAFYRTLAKKENKTFNK